MHIFLDAVYKPRPNTCFLGNFEGILLTSVNLENGNVMMMMMNRASKDFSRATCSVIWCQL